VHQLAKKLRMKRAAINCFILLPGALLTGIFPLFR
jgi:hypothetical protein